MDKGNSAGSQTPLFTPFLGRADGRETFLPESLGCIGRKEEKMNTLYIDCSSGASGDMMLGAFIDLGVPEEVLKGELSKLGIDEFCLKVRKTESCGVKATDADVILYEEENTRIDPYSGSYRNYGQIKNIIKNSSLSERAKSISRRIFDIKAKAEAKVHGVPEEEVRFHEAGAVDSLVDIVGTAICCDYLKIQFVISCSAPTGYGTVMCACGRLPVPAPAVKEILKDSGIPNYPSDIEQELLTPTGASILAGLADRFEPCLKVPKDAQMGFGTGKRNTGLPPLKLALADVPCPEPSFCK